MPEPTWRDDTKVTEYLSRIDRLTARHEGERALLDTLPSTVTSVAGYPNITVPDGFIHGLPVGLSFLGGAWQEPKLIRLAYAFEQATKARKSPTFLPTVSYNLA